MGGYEDEGERKSLIMGGVSSFNDPNKFNRNDGGMGLHHATHDLTGNGMGRGNSGDIELATVPPSGGHR